MSSRDFHHPYNPYPIQQAFMEGLYWTIEDRCVGIFESPTGTGKSLSLLCGAITWLRDHKRNGETENIDDNCNEPDWVIQHDKEEKQRRETHRKAEYEAKLKRIRDNELRSKKPAAHVNKRLKLSSTFGEFTDDEASFGLSDYDSDKEQLSGKLCLEGSNILPETQQLLKKLGHQFPNEETPDLDLEIFYATRTHSQLRQFVDEIRKVNIPPTFEPLDKPSQSGDFAELIKHISLGSRKTLCINPKVSRLHSANMINERCLELQKSGTPPDKKCPCLPPRKEQHLMMDTFKDHALARIRDIEDLAALGRQLGTCPYYASRASLGPTEIVTLPYPLLIQKSAREALGINLKGHIIIIDEAHNIIDAITSINSVSISLSQINTVKDHLVIYMDKFSKRLKGKNKVYIAQILRLLNALETFLQTRAKGNIRGPVLVDPSELFRLQGVDQVNIFKIEKYLKISNLARKIDGYSSYKSRKDAKTLAQAEIQSSDLPLLMQVSSFLVILANPSKEGRLFLKSAEHDTNDPCLKYMLLDPSHQFKDIAEEARAVVLAGGTMEPTSDFSHRLFPYLPQERVRKFSFGHVVPPENILAMPLSNSPGGKKFDFTFESRRDEIMIDELGRAILNICGIIPDGVVCFFPSYAYLKFVVARWQREDIWARLGQKKKLFQEPEETGAADLVLTDFSASINVPGSTGALLLSVVSGKMSEGINFSDSLGRGVIMVGLPFPNAMSIEWEIKLQYIEQCTFERLGHTLSENQKKQKAKEESREFLENTCMRAVNQSIGMYVDCYKE
ncbi:ATP-dependent DNA helicase chl1 [Neolecta irregularis DAH-3]|uniref:ATP-dependent DNA helicase CHL1 n=1 Tax=Neolecta irregularis (strain DAH-3) TaxID=1198029 RepID=A0A1U7LNR6_NEOID|nr:ATP-dependent DNA helicase chl1 [Neolecta irregularis DAH-3]|eukprot:OLL24306.1 ATP-dependent DNA helicase chl1 [Neolecta irregularis DAH-3]